MAVEAAPWYQWRGEDLLLRVWAQPRASRDCIVGLQDNCLKIKVTAPPADGRANDCIARVLARALGVPPSTVSLQSGATGRRKTFLIKNLGDKTSPGSAPVGLLPDPT